MFEALFWGLAAASSLLIGAIVALARPVGQRALGAIMAFGAGALISAVAYELIGEALDSYDATFATGVGLFAGALTFFAGDYFIDRTGGASRKSSAGSEPGSAPALVLGSVLDGIPESIVLGLSLLGGSTVSVSMLVGVFLSNLPESMAASTGLAHTHTRAWVLALWGTVVLVSGLSAAAGYALLDGASDTLLAFVLAFAGGAVLTMLSDTMMPEAYEYGGTIVGLLTTLGFAVAVFVSL